MMNVLKNEPVLVSAAVVACLAVAVGFGLDWSNEQLALVIAAVEALLALITRAFVSPVDTPEI